MAANKTQPTSKDVTSFINQAREEVREDCKKLLLLMQEVTNESPVMWGESIVGFGKYHYKYNSGREGDMPVTGFSPRKQNLTIYIMTGFDRYPQLMSKLGKYKTGKSCLYIKRLSDVDETVLVQLIKASVDYMDNKYNP